MENIDLDDLFKKGGDLNKINMSLEQKIDLILARVETTHSIIKTIFDLQCATFALLADSQIQKSSDQDFEKFVEEFSLTQQTYVNKGLLEKVQTYILKHG